MNTEQFIKTLSARTGYTEAACEKMVKAYGEVILETITEAKEKVAVARFGIFEPKLSKAKDVKSPMTKDTIHVPEKNGIRFKLSTHAKNLLNPA